MLAVKFWLVEWKPRAATNKIAQKYHETILNWLISKFDKREQNLAGPS